MQGGTTRNSGAISRRGNRVPAQIELVAGESSEPSTAYRPASQGTLCATTEDLEPLPDKLEALPARAYDVARVAVVRHAEEVAELVREREVVRCATCWRPVLLVVDHDVSAVQNASRPVRRISLDVVFRGPDLHVEDIATARFAVVDDLG